MGYDIEQVKSAGPRYFTGLWHANDFEIFNKYIFPETILFLNDQKATDTEKYSVSFNFRICNTDGRYKTMLQRSTYYVESENGTPLAAFGFLVDITEFKEDTRIIHTIEKIDRNFSSVDKSPCFKKIYYPDFPDNELTKRELQILRSIVRGLRSQEIARDMFVSVFTINNHRKNILQKTGAKNVSELIKYASARGIV